MANPDFNKTTTTGMTSAVSDYSTASKNTDGIYATKENRWNNSDFPTYYGFYNDVGEYKSAINAFATWVIGQGYEAEDAETKITLQNIRGWGEDTFLSILWNMLVIKKVAGDSFAEINRDEETGDLINLKVLNPYRMTTITNEKGIIIRYEYSQGDGKFTSFSPNKIFHLCNDRVADEPHGTAVTKAVEWAINTIKEARTDYRRILHRSTLRVLYIDETDTARLAKVKSDYAEAINKGEVIIIPCKKEDADFQDLVAPPAETFLAWIRYCEDHFYKALGVPKVVLGGTSENTEASAKVGVISYEPIWVREITELEADIWNQLAIRIKINKQPSLMDNMKTDEAANTGQTKLEYQGGQ